MSKTQTQQSIPPSIILVEPQLPENIGMVARAMGNFALTDLRLVAPRQPWPSEAGIKAASGADFVLENITVFARLEEAIADLHYLMATTARQRDMVKPVFSPRNAVREIQTQSQKGARCGILFGRESVGLTNDDIVLADSLITAPVNPAFASLNLAQSVLLMGYEWYTLNNHDGTLGRATAFDGPVREGLDLTHTRPASRRELLLLFEHLESELEASGYFPTPETRPNMVKTIRNIIHRMQPTEQDVRTLRGVIAALSRKRRSRQKLP